VDRPLAPPKSPPTTSLNPHEDKMLMAGNLADVYEETASDQSVTPEHRDSKWYVLQIHPQHEGIAAAHLIGRRFKVYLPTMLSTSTRSIRRRKVKIARPIFPGYLFIFIDFDRDDRLHFVHNAPGVHKFLQLGTDLAIISQLDMDRIGRIEEALMKPREKASIWNVGEVVRIGDGPFTGLTAKIARLDENDRITVLLTLLGRATPVTLPDAELEKL
jgi:transcription termination/antitermination protein NusG